MSFGDPLEIRLHLRFAQIVVPLRRVAAGGAHPHRIYIIRISIDTKKRATRMGGSFFGDPLEIRTPDPLLKRQLLCQLS